MWWTRHLWVIFLQVVTVLPYWVASYRFFRGRDRFMPWLAAGIGLDVVLAVSASSGMLPRMDVHRGAPWGSVLFWVHIVCAGAGLFGFLALFLTLLIRGSKREYPRLRRLQYLVLLRLWLFGVGTALVNFLVEVFFRVRLYDLL